MSRPGVRFFSSLSLLLASCQKPPPETAAAPETTAECSARLDAFEAAVARMPARTVAVVAGTELPTSMLGALPGPGPVLEVSERGASFDGDPLPGASAAERAARLKTSIQGAVPAEAASGTPARAAFYVAATADTDVQTLRAYLTQVPPSFDLRLLVRLPRPPNGGAPAPTQPGPDDPATQLLLEQNPDTRRQIAERGYAELADCGALSSAVASVRGLGPRERWPALKTALAAALPQCDCSKLDTARLLPLVAAEQQGGAGTIGFLPISFLRDERCGASMPLRSMRKLIRQIEQFDEEFAGNWQHDALAFGNVVTDDRLRVYFCNALPGETLAAKERERATVYLRGQGADACEGWRFEPLEPGSPMGTLRRVGGPEPPLAFHYWQAAEEIRVFGPVDPRSPSKPTDHRDWSCEQTHHLTGIDDESISVDGGRWFFDDAACRKAGDAAAGALLCTGTRSTPATPATPEGAPPQ